MTGEHTAHELMEYHVEALYTQDHHLRLRTINEPWPTTENSAPRFFLGRTVEGTAVCRFRYDVSDDVARQIMSLCEEEPGIKDFRAMPRHFERYRKLLNGQKYSMGPCYLVPAETSSLPQGMAPHTVRVTRQNVKELSHCGFEWLVNEIDYVQPCIAIVYEGLAVSVCRSVRLTSRVHEAGIETLCAFRGKGYASRVLAGWATAVRKAGCIPFYSTSCENISSQSVARKSALVLYGVDFTVS